MAGTDAGGRLGADWAYRRLFDSSLYTEGISAYYTVSFLLWPFESMVRNALLLTMIVLGASSRPRNGIDSDLRRWVFAGYFVVNGTVMLATTLSTAIGVVLVQFVPAATESSAILNFWPLKFPSIALVNGIQVFLEIVFLLGALVMMITSLLGASRYGSTMATFVSRRWRTCLAIWCFWTFGWSTVGGIMNHLANTDPDFVPLDLGLSWFGLSVLRLSSVFDTLFWVVLIGLAILAHSCGRREGGHHPGDLLDA